MALCDLLDRDIDLAEATPLVASLRAFLAKPSTRGPIRLVATESAQRPLRRSHPFPHARLFRSLLCTSAPTVPVPVVVIIEGAAALVVRRRLRGLELMELVESRPDARSGRPASSGRITVYDVYGYPPPA
jgi:hypothetical protein